jgi:hypothetical protein
MASVHIPLFLDKRWVRRHEGRPCIDGSVTFFLRRKPWHFKAGDRVPSLVLHHEADTKLMAKEWSFLETISVEAFGEMYRMGYDHVAALAAEGGIPALNRTRGAAE